MYPGEAVSLSRALTVKRHHPVVRITHWINVVALTLMVGSGLRIFNAYPAFARRGESFCCFPFEGQGIPDWLTFGGWLAGARNWHFAMMWVLVANGIVYLGWIYLHGEWRDLVPRRNDPRDAWQMIRFYLFLRPRHPHQGKHNVLQKLTYFSLPLIAILAVLSGLAIWKPVSLAFVTDLLGGYVWARYWHFMAMIGLVLLSAIHVFMVFAVDPYSIVSMVTGRYDRQWSPESRNARFPPVAGSHYLPVETSPERNRDRELAGVSADAGGAGSRSVGRAGAVSPSAQDSEGKSHSDTDRNPRHSHRASEASGAALPPRDEAAANGPIERPDKPEGGS